VVALGRPRDARASAADDEPSAVALAGDRSGVPGRPGVIATVWERRLIVPKTAQDGATESVAASSAEDQLVREGDIAGDYLERLLDVLDYDGDIDLDVEAGRAIVSIDGGEDLDKLVGERGAVLEALQELTRLAVQQTSGNRSRLMLDIAGWREARREELTKLGTRTAKDVLASGESVRLRPMTPFERKVVHDAVARVKGVSSESEGEEPRRQVVVFRGA
jgi:spoIIIJ-associated protein